MQKLTIATRQSPLAVAQALIVKNQLLEKVPNLEINLLKLQTTGDQILNSSLSKIGGKGLFIKELQQALIDGKADLAVHSLKDIPYNQIENLQIVAICERSSPFDAFISNKFSNLNDLPETAKIGTSSLRRSLQLLAKFPNLEITPLRGNINTRLAKLDAGEFDAIILANAGLMRLTLQHRISEILPPEIMLPAAGQGALAIEMCKNHPLIDKIKMLNHQPSVICCLAERKVCEILQSDCSTPLASFAQILGENLKLSSLIASNKNNQIIKSTEQITLTAELELSQALKLGETVAQNLIAKGAFNLLAKL